MKYILVRMFLWVSFSQNAQVLSECTSTDSLPENLVEMIIGEGVEFSNVIYRGHPCSAGSFNGIFERGFGAGLVLATDGVISISPGNHGENYRTYGIESDLSKQLEMIGAISSQLYNVITIEFDFIPKSDQLSFEYIFASNEYSSFTCSKYNDIFGFFLSGPGIVGPFTNNAQNIALVPDPHDSSAFTGTPVIINSINSGRSSNFDESLCDSIDVDWRSYSKFYVDNSSKKSISFLGHTTPLKSTARVIPCETYHIKLAIADCSDGLLNSAVFLKRNSFHSVPKINYSVKSNMSDVFDSLKNPNHLYEGCGPATISFKRNDALKGTVAHKISVSGTARNQLDYYLTNIEDSLVIIPEDDSLATLIISVPNDSIDEEVEQLTLRVYPWDQDCYEDFYDSIVFKIFDQPKMALHVSDDIQLECPGDELSLRANASGGIAGLLDSQEIQTSFNYQWLDLGFGAHQMVRPKNAKTYYVLATDLCDQQVIDSIFVAIAPQEPLIIDAEQGTQCSYQMEELCVNVLSGNGGFNYSWPDGSKDSCNLVFPGVYPVIVNDKCSNEVTAYAQLELDVLPKPLFEITDVIGDTLALRLNNLTLKSNDYEYAWDFGDASGSNEYQPETHYYDAHGNYYLQLKIFNTKTSCYRASGEWVKVAPSYHFFAPNSFSPNGDGLNDVFKPVILGHQDYKLLIYDRWGHQVFYSDELAKGWDGTLDDKPLKSGIYVYRIYVTEFLTNLSFQETGTLNLFR